MGLSWKLLSLAHLVGLSLALGCATTKVALLLRCRAEPDLVQAYLKVVRPITRLLITGLVLLTLSGIGWLLLSYPFSTPLLAKLVLVVAVWAMGPVIDKVLEPRFAASAPAPGEAPSEAFNDAMRKYFRMELAATGVFYAIVLLWVMK